MDRREFIILPIIVVLVTCITTEAGDWDIPTEKEKFHIFILMGQSNMAGGIKGDHLLPEDKQPVPHIVHIPTPTTRNFGWKPAAHPLHIRTNRPKSFGPGLPFAKEHLKNHPGVMVGLIPVAKGGARIDILKKGSKIYEDAIKKARFAAVKGTIGLYRIYDEREARIGEMTPTGDIPTIVPGENRIGFSC